MKEERPKIKVPFKPIDIVIEASSITVLVLMWTHLSVEYNSLPKTIASHFNAFGKPDGYSDKTFLWFLPVLATILYSVLFLLNRFPHLHNYMVNITEKNALIQYRFSTRILRIVNFLCTIMFAYINYQIILGAKTHSSNLGMPFIIIVVSVSLLLPVFIFIYQKKLKKN